MNKKSKIEITILSTVPFLMVLGNSMLIPEFPKISAALNITQFQVGLLITLFSASAGIAIPVLGYLSDKFSRKAVLVPSILVYGLGGLISGLAAIFFKEKGYYLVLVGRVVQGIGAAGTYPIVIALVGDIFQSKERSEALGIIEAANGLGKVFSPLLGAAIALIVWYALFFSYALLAIPIALAVYFIVQEPKNDNENKGFKDYITKIVEIFKAKGVALFFTLLAGITVLFILFGVLSFISEQLENKYQIVGLTKGLLISLPILFMSISSYLSGWYLQKKGKFYKYSMTLGLFISFISLISLPFFDGIVSFILLIALLGIGNGLVLPALNTLVTGSTGNKQRGGITSLYGSSRFLGVAFGPPVFSLLNQISSTVMFITAAIISLSVAITTFFLIKEEKLIDFDNQNNN